VGQQKGVRINHNFFSAFDSVGETHVLAIVVVVVVAVVVLPWLLLLLLANQAVFITISGNLK